MKQRHLLLVIIAVTYLAGNFILERWTFDLYYGDPNGYYLHVVSFFVNQDVGDYDETITSLREVNPASADPREDKYGIRLTDKGRRYIKYTLGVPLMETPFFLLAHAYASLSNTVEANGWTKPYLFAIGLSTIFYVLIGFYFLILVLEKHFNRNVTALVVLSIAFATNLFFHATYTTMAHAFLFFDYCILIYLSDRFYEKPDWKKALGIGVMVGLITLTRVPEIISVLIPLLWGVVKVNDLRDRISFFIKQYKLLIVASLGFLFLFSIQFVYWYYVSGQLVFNPYQGEGFNFLKPHIYKGWFDFANGWLVYTPIMGFSIIGLFYLRKYAPASFFPILLFVFLHAYIHYSYYVWTYFPGFGQRPMVETYPLLAFSLAALYQVMLKKKWLKVLLLIALFCFTLLNLFQTWQMKEGVIWTERGNTAFYMATFGRLNPTLNSLRAFDSKVIQPDSSEIVFVKNIIDEGFEDSLQYTTSSEIKWEGQSSFFSQEDMVWIKKGEALPEDVAQGWLGISTQVYMRGSDKIWGRHQCLSLIVIIYNEDNIKRKESHIVPSSHIGNKDFNIWTTGETDQWGQASFFMKMPHVVRKGWTIDIMILNTYGQKLFLDDLRVDHFKKSGS